MLRWVVHLKGGPRRHNHAAVVLGQQELYSFGRICFNKDYCNCHQPFDVSVFNTVSLRWTQLPPVTPERGECLLEAPYVCWFHTAVLIEETVYIWRGKPHCNVLYAFHVGGHRWFRHSVSGTVPEAREGHSACVLGKVMYVHGGYEALSGHTNGVYKLDTSTMLWTLISTRGTPPPASSCHSATIIGTKMFVFGGWGGYRGHRVYNNIRVFDAETNSWLSAPLARPLPEGRWGHSAFTYNGELYVLGGQNSCASPCFSDLWTFNPETLSWKGVEPRGKGPRWITEMCCCIVGDRVVLFGGKTANLLDPYSVDDLYILDLSPSLKTLCKLAVLQYALQPHGLPHNVLWELAAMTPDHHQGEAMAAEAAGLQSQQQKHHHGPVASMTAGQGSVRPTKTVSNFIVSVFCTFLSTVTRVLLSKEARVRMYY